MWLATESIYQALYRHQTGLLRRAKTVDAVSPLRTSRDHRRGHTRVVRAGRRFAQPMPSIHDRGFEPTDRSRPGTGRETSSSVRITARPSRPGRAPDPRHVKLVYLRAQDSATLRSRLVTRSTELPSSTAPDPDVGPGHRDGPRPRRSPRRIGMKVFFCDAAYPLAAGLEREHQRPAAPVLPEVDRPFGPHPTRSREGRERAQRPAATHPRRPRANRAFQRTANVRIHPDVAMTAGNQGVGSD